MLYRKGFGFGSFIWGEFNSDDLDKIIDQHLEELAEIDRAFEKLDLKDLDPI